jgi:hypothetical protein
MNSSFLSAAPWWRTGAGHALVIHDGRPLVGTYPISGAKNAVLPLLVSALLTPRDARWMGEERVEPTPAHMTRPRKTGTPPAEASSSTGLDMTPMWVQSG